MHMLNIAQAFYAGKEMRRSSALKAGAGDGGRPLQPGQRSGAQHADVKHGRARETGQKAPKSGSARPGKRLTVSS